MVTVPAATPVTTPVDAFTEAIVALPVVHRPPLTVLVNVAVVPVHAVDGPLIVPALAPVVTVTFAVAVVLPQLLVTV